MRSARNDTEIDEAAVWMIIGYDGETDTDICVKGADIAQAKKLADQKKKVPDDLLTIYNWKTKVPIEPQLASWMVWCSGCSPRMKHFGGNWKITSIRGDQIKNVFAEWTTLTEISPFRQKVNSSSASASQLGPQQANPRIRKSISQSQLAAASYKARAIEYDDDNGIYPSLHRSAQSRIDPDSSPTPTVRNTQPSSNLNLERRTFRRSGTLKTFVQSIPSSSVALPSTLNVDKDGEDGTFHSHTLDIKPIVTTPPSSADHATITFDISKGRSIKQRIQNGTITPKDLSKELHSYLKVNLSEREAIELQALVLKAKWSIEKACENIIGSRFIRQFFE